jgi:hypothetical protein
VNDSGHSVPAVCSKQPTDVLEHAQPGRWVHSPDAGDDVIEQPPLVVDALSFACAGHGLAREPCCEDVDRVVGPGEGGEVAVVRHLRVVVGEDAGRVVVVLTVPHHVSAEDVLDGLLEAAVPGAEGADLHVSRQMMHGLPDTVRPRSPESTIFPAATSSARLERSPDGEMGAHL